MSESVITKSLSAETSDTPVINVSFGKTEGTAQCSVLYSVVILAVSCNQTEVTALGSAFIVLSL